MNANQPAITLNELENGDCLIMSASGEGAQQVIGRFHAKTGNVLAQGEPEDTDAPAVLCIGDPAGTTGQLKSRQPAGNYLRVCRWDRVAPDQAPANQPSARFLTLPQCGCGGYLGTPKFFDSFPEMAAHVFCNFFDAGDQTSCPA